MSVEVSRLPTGLTVVTDKMPHLETTSLGIWIASGSRHEAPEGTVMASRGEAAGQPVRVIG